MAAVAADVHNHHRVPNGGRSQLCERNRPQEVFESLDLVDLVHGGVPIPGGLPPLLEHPQLSPASAGVGSPFCLPNLVSAANVR